MGIKQKAGGCWCLSMRINKKYYLNGIFLWRREQTHPAHRMVCAPSLPFVLWSVHQSVGGECIFSAIHSTLVELSILHSNHKWQFLHIKRDILQLNCIGSTINTIRMNGIEKWLSGAIWSYSHVRISANTIPTAWLKTKRTRLRFQAITSTLCILGCVSATKNEPISRQYRATFKHGQLGDTFQMNITLNALLCGKSSAECMNVHNMYPNLRWNFHMYMSHKNEKKEKKHSSQHHTKMNINKSRKIPRIFPINFVFFQHSLLFLVAPALLCWDSIALQTWHAIWPFRSRNLQLHCSSLVGRSVGRSFVRSLLVAFSVFVWICAALPFLFGAWSSKNDMFCVCVFIAVLFFSLCRLQRHEIKVKYFAFFLFLYGLVFSSCIAALRCVVVFCVFRWQILFTYYLTALQIRFRFCIKRVILLFFSRSLSRGGFIFCIKRLKMKLHKFHYISLFGDGFEWKWRMRKKKKKAFIVAIVVMKIYGATAQHTRCAMYTANKKSCNAFK